MSRFFMAHLLGHTGRMGSALGWPWLLATALLLAGCGDPFTAAPQACAPGEAAREGGGCEPRKPCALGELTLESGECQPAGLPPDMQCPPGELALASGGCQPAGLPPDMQCPPGELALANGGCQPAGVPPEACGEGFEPDGDRGCEAILPAEACPPGLMAIPGETTCREVAPCGDGPWGSIPVEASTQFVDQAYAGGDSDGTAARPWTRVQDGVDAAEDGAIVAVTDGTYVEDVLIVEKAVRLWGRCPGRVEIQGTGLGIAAIRILTSAADGAEIRGVAVAGAAHGIVAFGASGVTIEAVWIHDAAGRGLDVEGLNGPASVALSGALIERNHDEGIFILGARAEIDATEVRSTQPLNGSFGLGIGVQDDPATGERADVAIRASLIDRNHDVGVFVGGSDATIEGTVVRSTQPTDGHFGWGIAIQGDRETGERADVAIRGCLVDQNHEKGVLVLGSSATIEGTVVRSTQLVGGQYGAGVHIMDDRATGERADVSVRACLVDQNPDVGVFIGGSDAAIEATVVRSTRLVNEDSGQGIAVEDNHYTHQRADASIRASLVDRNDRVGVHVKGSDVEIEATTVRAGQPVNDSGGWGVLLQNNRATRERADVSVRACVVEQNHDIGLLVQGSDARVEATVVRSTQPVGAESGRGIGIQDDSEVGERADVSVLGCLVEQNHNIGVFVGGSDAEIVGTVVRATQAVGEDSGRGISIEYNAGKTGERADVSVRGCLVEENHTVGVFVGGSDAEIVGTVVRSTKPANGQFGRGIGIQDDIPSGERADVSVRGCLIEENHDVGVFVASSHAELEATVIRSTQQLDGQFGAGVVVFRPGPLNGHADASFRGSLVEGNHLAGVAIAFAEATIEDTVVRDTRADPHDDFGDGIAVENGTAMIRGAYVTRNARAGIASWGSQVTIVSSTITCNTFDLNGETHHGLQASFDGSSDWHCSSSDAESCAETGACSVNASHLGPPPPFKPLEPPDPAQQP